MAYNFQTFSIGQILTAAQMNQVEESIRDHIHGTAGVSAVSTFVNLTGHVTSVGNAAVLGSFTSAQLLAALTDETGTGLAVFNTSPTLVTPVLGTPASGNLVNCTGLATLSANTFTGIQSITKDNQTGYASAGLQVSTVSSSTGDAYISLITQGATVGVLKHTRGDSGFSIRDASNALANLSIGTLAAGTVPLARMIRAGGNGEMQGSGTTTATLDLGTVVAGDRIHLTGDVVIGTANSPIFTKSAGTATVDFAGATRLIGGYDTTLAAGGIGGVCRVTSGGTLTLQLGATGGTPTACKAHAIVLNNG